MNPDQENHEGQIYSLVESYNKNNQALEKIKEEKDRLAKAGQRDGELFDVLNTHLVVARRLAAEISQLLPKKENISATENVAWSGRLSNIEFEFLSGNKFKIKGPNLIVSENEIEDNQIDDIVVVTVGLDVDIPVFPDDSVESLYGLEVKIYRAE